MIWKGNTVLCLFLKMVSTLNYWLELNLVEFKGSPSKRFYLLCDKIFKFSSISKNDSFGITTISLELSALATHTVPLLFGTRPRWLRFDWTYFEQKILLNFRRILHFKSIEHFFFVLHFH